MAKKQSRGLGAATKQHANGARVAVAAAENDVKHAMTGSCGMRFTSLVHAYHQTGQAWAQAFRSGGKVSKGAFTSKTVDTVTAKRIYDVEEALDRANESFRSTCLRPSRSR